MPRSSLLLSSLLAPALLLAFALVAPRSARANERHLTYTYESAVLPQGARELEVWTTPRLGRDTYFARFDHRLEFEVGLTGKLQTSLYLNFAGETAETAPGIRSSSMIYEGVSSEWKYKISDPVADALGFALYGELTGSTDMFEFEGKLIFDKMLGRLLLAGNLVGAIEYEFKATDSEPELEVELDLAGTYFLTPHLALGLEVRNHNMFEEAEEWEHSSLFAGPVIAYAASSWWVALTVFPQLPALKKPEGSTGSLVLDEHEKFNARLLFSFQL